MSTVKRNGEPGKRPAWDYQGQIPDRGFVLDQLEMLESIRNCLEQVRDSQMLQCSVAHNIATLVREIRGLRLDLKARRKRP